MSLETLWHYFLCFCADAVGSTIQFPQIVFVEENKKHIMFEYCSEQKVSNGWYHPNENLKMWSNLMSAQV